MVTPSIRKWIALGLVGAQRQSSVSSGKKRCLRPRRATEPIELTLRAPDAGEVGEVIALIADGVQAVAQVVEEVQSVDEAQPSEYYIGIALGELPAVVKAQLKLDHGLVVDDVFADSPAAKAEFKAQDILLRADEKNVQQPADIMKAVDEAKDRKMRIIVLRDGKEMSLQVTPTKRPKPEAELGRGYVGGSHSRDRDPAD